MPPAKIEEQPCIVSMELFPAPPIFETWFPIKKHAFLRPAPAWRRSTSGSTILFRRGLRIPSLDPPVATQPLSFSDDESSDGEFGKSGVVTEYQVFGSTFRSGGTGTKGAAAVKKDTKEIYKHQESPGMLNDGGAGGGGTEGKSKRKLLKPLKPSRLLKKKALTAEASTTKKV